MISDYVVTKNGYISAILCKGCGVEISKLIPHDTPVATERINGRTIIRERMVLAQLPHYREVLIEFDDGTRHVTPMCADCAQKMQGDVEMQEAVHTADLRQWDKEGSKINIAYTRRLPVGVKKVANHIPAGE